MVNTTRGRGENRERGTHSTDWWLFTLVSSRVWITARANLEFLARVVAFSASELPNNLPKRIVRNKDK